MTTITRAELSTFLDHNYDSVYKRVANFIPHRLGKSVRAFTSPMDVFQDAVAKMLQKCPIRSIPLTVAAVTNYLICLIKGQTSNLIKKIRRRRAFWERVRARAGQQGLGLIAGGLVVAVLWRPAPEAPSAAVAPLATRAETEARDVAEPAELRQLLRANAALRARVGELVGELARTRARLATSAEALANAARREEGRAKDADLLRAELRGLLDVVRPRGAGATAQLSRTERAVRIARAAARNVGSGGAAASKAATERAVEAALQNNARQIRRRLDAKIKRVLERIF